MTRTTRLPEGTGTNSTQVALRVAKQKLDWADHAGTAWTDFVGVRVPVEVLRRLTNLALAFQAEHPRLAERIK